VNIKQTILDRLMLMRPSEAEVARRLVRILALVAEKSLRDIAVLCQTSDATVMRTCRAAGFDGYQDLKYHVLREFTSGNLRALPSGTETYSADISASVEAARKALGAAAQMIHAANRIILAGIGASHGIAVIATDILFTLQKQALTLLSDQMLTYALSPPVDGLLLLAISHSGETQFAVRAAQQCRESGIKTIGLTNEPASELAQAVDVVLLTQAVEPPEGSYAVAPRICQLAVLDLLFSQVQLLISESKKGVIFSS
jgi:DNA-binding MurR/RpiR family transcriptional regulator